MSIELSTSDKQDKVQFRSAMFEKFLNSDYWEAGLSGEQLQYRFGKFLADMLYDFKTDEPEITLTDDREPLMISMDEYFGVAI